MARFKFKHNRHGRKRNPMPKTGALFLVNGKGRGKKSSPFSRVLARLNGKHRKRNGMVTITARNFRQNPWAGLAIRTNRGRKGAPRNLRTGRFVKRNPLAIRTNPLAIRTNPFHGLAIRTNSGGIMGMLQSPIGAVQNLISKVPFIGKPVAKYAGPVLAGGAALGLVHMALAYGGSSLIGMAPEMVRPYLEKGAYTLGGVAVSLVLPFVPFFSTSTKMAIGLTAISAGAAVDLYRHFTGASLPSSDGLLADGFLSQTVPLGSTDGYAGDADAQACYAGYADVVPADATASGPDLDPVEGEAAVRGPRFWAMRFPFRRRIYRQQDGRSKHAGEHGHRWGWLIRLVGWENFQKLAAMPRESRVAYIRQLRDYAVQSISNMGPTPASDMQPLSGLLMVGGPF